MSEVGTVIRLEDEPFGGLYMDEFYVRGHVHPMDAEEALRSFLEEEDDDFEVPKHTPWQHYWAGWRFTGEIDEDGKPRLAIVRYSVPGRGKFPVTWCRDQGRQLELDHQRGLR